MNQDETNGHVNEVFFNEDINSGNQNHVAIKTKLHNNKEYVFRPSAISIDFPVHSIIQSTTDQFSIFGLNFQPIESYTISYWPLRPTLALKLMKTRQWPVWPMGSISSILHHKTYFFSSKISGVEYYWYQKQKFGSNGKRWKRRERRGLRSRWCIQEWYPIWKFHRKSQRKFHLSA